MYYSHLLFKPFQLLALMETQQWWLVQQEAQIHTPVLERSSQLLEYIIMSEPMLKDVQIPQRLR